VPIGGVHDLVKSLLLLRIEFGVIILDILKHLNRIISKLLFKERVVDVRPPLLLWSVHVLYVRKMFSIRLYGDVLEEIYRVRHGYGNTRSDRVTGTTGTGTVLVFGTPRHTVYPYHGITGIHGYIKTE